jgi:hypothetical protein
LVIDRVVNGKKPRALSKKYGLSSIKTTERLIGVILQKIRVHLNEYDFFD